MGVVTGSFLSCFGTDGLASNLEEYYWSSFEIFRLSQLVLVVSSRV